MSKVIIPVHIGEILVRLRNAGFEAYLVGGCVRDSVLKRSVHDWDIASSARPDEVIALFEKTIATGVRFGGVTVVLPENADSVEITAFRADGRYLDGRRPEDVEFGVSLAADLSRRDFTMNAMAVSESGAVIDPFCGLEDIKNRVIRCVGNPEQRFSEDALRMLRALRFSAELGFSIDPATRAAIEKLSPLSRKLSAERVRNELQKTLLSPRPELLDVFLRHGLLNSYIQGAFTGPNLFPPLQKLPVEASLRWCAFCAILAESGVVVAESGFLRALRLPEKMVRLCGGGAQLARSGFPDERAGMKRLLSEHGVETVRCAAAVRDALFGGAAEDFVREILQSGEAFSLSDLAISGKDLLERGYPPGTALGAALQFLLSHIIEHPGDNTRETLLGLAGSFKA